MQSGRGIKRIELDHADYLPRLDPPAGYVILLADVAYGRFKTLRSALVDRQQIESGADYPFEVAISLIFQADNAAAAELRLHDQFVAQGEIDDWFDLDEAQLAQLDAVGQPQAVTLRHLTLPAAGGESLLGAAKIVSTAQQPAATRARRPRKQPLRRLRTLIALLLLAAVAAYLASLALQYVEDNQILRTLMPAQTQASSSRPATAKPTAAPVDDVNEVWYAARRVFGRNCPRINCTRVSVLEAGQRIVAQGFVRGQSVAGNDRWIAFRHLGANLHAHSSLFTRERPTAMPTAQASATSKPTRTPAPSDTPAPTATATTTATTATSAPTATADTSEALIVVTRDNLRARARSCPGTDCEILAHLYPGAELRGLERVEGEGVNGSAEWIRFRLDGQDAYIHSSLASPSS